MNFKKGKGSIVFIATIGGGDKCPRMVSTNSNANFKDDYKGSIKISKRLTGKLLLG
ncbi:MAG: hypothetical protein KGH54_00340 [Candidatus Micrarchaeota archaeon]|nr:hypothetical protein [Candidatus Micrarchaeota archaeon]